MELRSDNTASRSMTPAEPPAVLVELLSPAGIRFNGRHPWDIQVSDPDLFRQVLARGSLGFGEAYMDGAWESERLDETATRLLRAEVDLHLTSLVKLRSALWLLQNRLLNRQSKKRASRVARRHYDLDNELFEAMLDPSMSYSCAYWKEADNLNDAQRAKLRLSCEKLHLQAGQRLLDIGSGWGGLARFAAENYGVEVVGVTISREQAALARARCRGLPVRIELQDYRDIQGRFDRVISIGMFEHVGPKNYADFFATVDRVLEPGGLFLLHTIGSNRVVGATDPWIEKYIFPNGHLPAASQLTAAFEAHFQLLDWHNFGPYYDRTLMAWWENFQRAWPRLRSRYDERFYRMWKYYLMVTAGFFRARRGQLWQLVLSKGGFPGVYQSVR